MTTTSDAPGGWTYSEYARLPDDGNRYEVIDGEVCVTPASGPRHQDVAGRLYRRLTEYVERHGLGKVFWDVDLLFRSGPYLRPDLVFVPVSGLDGVTDRGVESVPGLVVEVVSLHSGQIDRVKKPGRYRDFGVAEYWVVEPRTRAVDAYRMSEWQRSPRVCAARLGWQPDPAVPALDLDVADLFAAG